MCGNPNDNDIAWTCHYMTATQRFFGLGEGYTLVVGTPTSIDIWIAATRHLSNPQSIFLLPFW